MKRGLGYGYDGVAAKVPEWKAERRIVAHHQVTMAEAGFDVGLVDGLIGPQTLFALEEWEQRALGKPPIPWRDALPDDDDVERMIEVYGEPGPSEQVVKRLPYPMRLAWHTSTRVNKFRMHRLVIESAQEALEAVARIYDETDRAHYGLDLFGGTYNYRKKRGGSSWSTHAWGVAIDIDPLRNPLRAHETDNPPPMLSSPALGDFWRCWEDRGWVSLGRTLDFDWMHIQKARV